MFRSISASTILIKQKNISFYCLFIAIFISIINFSLANASAISLTKTTINQTSFIYANPLGAKITLKVNAVNIEEFLKEIRKQTDFPIGASKLIKDKVITASIQDRTLKDIFSSLHELFGYRLKYYQKTNNYILYEGDHSKRVEAIKAKKLEDFSRRLKVAQQLYASDPNINQPANVFQRSFAFLKPIEIFQLLMKKTFKIPFASLDTVSQAGLRLHLSTINYGSKPDEMHPPTEDDVNNSLISFTVGGDGGDLFLSGGYNFNGIGMSFILVPPPMFADDQHNFSSQVLPGNFDKDAASTFINPSDVFNGQFIPEKNLKPDVPLVKNNITVIFPEKIKLNVFSGKYNDPLSPTDVIFQNFAKQTKVNFIADSYVNCCLASDDSLDEPFIPKNIQDQLLGDALDNISRSLHYEWGISNSIIFFRNPRWYVDESKEPPVNVTRKWVQYWQQRKEINKPLTIKEVAALASTLPLSQMQSLGRLVPIVGRIYRVAGPFALYLALSKSEQNLMETDKGIAWARLTATQKQLLLNKVPDDVREKVKDRLASDPDSRFRIQIRESQIWSEFTNSGTWNLDIALPVIWYKQEL